MKVTGTANALVALAIAMAKAAVEILSTLVIDVTLSLSSRNTRARNSAKQEACHLRQASGAAGTGRSKPFGGHGAYFSGACPRCRKTMLPLDADRAEALPLPAEEKPECSNS
jgi:hypothetical protein